MRGDAPTPFDQERLEDVLQDLANLPPGNSPLARWRRGAVAWAQRVTERGPMRSVAEVGWQVARRDQAVAGSVLAAALAYRLFIWFLPFALLLVVGVGVHAQDSGLSGIVADSVEDAANDITPFARASALVVGFVVLVYETYVLLRAVRAVSSLAWGVPVRRLATPAPTSLAFLGLLVLASLAAAVIAPIREHVGFPLGILPLLVGLAVMPAFWLVVCVGFLPSRTEAWPAHVPGAILFAVCLWAIQLFNSLVLFPWLAHKEDTYGVLGLAAGILFSLFLIGRVIELSLSLNAVLYERRHGPAPQ